jgi:hypothetical protein
VQSSGNFGAHGERPLCAGPHGEFSVLPFGDSGARFEGRVRDVGNRVGGIQAMCGAGETFLDGTDLFAGAVVGFVSGILFEIGEEFAVRDLRHFVPLGSQRGERGLRLVLAGGCDADKIGVANDHCVGESFCGAVVQGRKRGAERSRPQNLSVVHAGRTQIGGVLVLAGNEGAGVRLGNGFSGDGPFRRRGDGIFAGKGLRKGLAARELRVGGGAAGGRVQHFCVGGF